MTVRKTLLLSAIVAVCALPAVSYADFTVIQTGPPVIQTNPPVPVYEQVPAPREGFVWIPGHFRMDGDQQVWISGYWQRDPNYGVIIRERYRDEEHHWWNRHHRDDD